MALYNSPGHSTSTSAAMSSSTPNKRIFAPGGTNDSQQAQQYTKGSLEADQLDPNPLTQFDIWFQHANAEKVHQPETVTLSTAELPSGRVSARMVYLKELDDKGWVVYSNWGTSRKAADVKSNPHASLTFWWHELERQVRVEGRVERMTSEESQVYYDTRIRGSRMGAWASQQSSVLSSREELEKQVEDVEKRFDGQDKIPVPEFWGGIRVIPEMVEFWQGRPSRLHDRFRYTRDEKSESGWKVDRLSPANPISLPPLYDNIGKLSSWTSGTIDTLAYRLAFEKTQTHLNSVASFHWPWIHACQGRNIVLSTIAQPDHNNVAEAWPRDYLV
ncbi:pyridoxamine 5'-phosphate oxidase [Aureobasidium pullulans]|nr:pyridoxamine 5'-phosphate oxidase [Aureobasidium pullulans]